MLREVEAQVNKKEYKKTDVQEILLDEGLLKMFNLWLRGVDGALPNLDVRTTIFRLLDKLKIDEGLLSESGICDFTVVNARVVEDTTTQLKLGRVLMQCLRHKSETVENKAFLRKLVNKWIGPQQDYRELKNFENEKIKEILERKRQIGSRHYYPTTAGPQNVSRSVPVTMDYVVRPQPRQIGKPDDEAMEYGGRRSATKLGAKALLEKTLRNAAKEEGLRARPVNINGKNLAPHSRG